MPQEGPRTDIQEQQRKKLAGIFERCRVADCITERGQQFGTLLRTFEDRMRPGETIAVFNYGSNSPDELKELFSASGVSSNFEFGGLAELKGIELAFGSRSQKRGSAVATLRESADAQVVGYFALVTKDQFKEIARRECGNTMGRERDKGRYRRAVIYFDDPRDRTKEIQAVTFVLNERYSEFNQYPVANENLTRQRIQGSAEESRFNEYASLVNKQQRQTQDAQKSNFFGAPPLTARWNSRGYRQQS